MPWSGDIQLLLRPVGRRGGGQPVTAQCMRDRWLGHPVLRASCCWVQDPDSDSQRLRLGDLLLGQGRRAP